MALNKFKEQVEKGIKGLSREKVVLFTWRSAVLALPFLGKDGSLEFWPQEKRKQYLFSVFNALNVAAANAAIYTDVNTAVNANTFSNTVAYANAYAVAYAAANAHAAANANTYASAAANTNAVNAANAAKAANALAVTYVVAAADAAAAANAANTANAVYDSFDYFDANVAYDANARAATRVATRVARAADICQIDFKPVLTELLKNANIGSNSSVTVPLSLYGDIWANFQKALAAEGCVYWGKVYTQIFKNGLTIDRDAALRRLNVPKEIQDQGAAAVGDYLEKLETEGAERLNEARIIILGEKGAGKTCLARRLVNPDAPMTTDEESTAGVDTLSWKLEDENVNVRIWDFAGHVVTHAVHQFFLSERSLYIIVYDGRSEQRNRLEYWLDHMKNYGGDSKAIILINRRDPHPVDIQENNLREKYAIEDVYNFSIGDNGTGLRSFRKAVADYIVKNPTWSHQEIPTPYFAVKQQLEELFEKGNGKRCENYISRKQFDSIAAHHAIKDTKQLLTDLHALGVSLWYHDMEKFDTLVLNPEWISHGVYKIINWADEQKLFTIAMDDFKTIFSDELACRQYPEDKYQFLFDLMKKYMLAFETESGGRLIIPHLLNEDRPKDLPSFDVGESLMARYKAEQPLPPNAISQFIVHHHKGIVKQNDYLVWRYGVVLTDGKGSTALVRQDDRTISVSVKGPDKKHFLDDLRTTLNEIFNRFKSEKPELQYRIEYYGLLPEENITRMEPLWLPDRKIWNHIAADKPYYDDRTGRDISLQRVALNYNITIGNLISGAGNIIDQSTRTFNFSQCNFDLQSHLNELAGLLSRAGNPEEATTLQEAAEALKPVEESTDKKEVKRSGALNGVRRIADQLSDKKSLLNKAVNGVKNGISIAKDIMKAYSAIHGWMG